MLQPKEHFIEKLEQLLSINNHTKILDLGCGQSKNILPLLQKMPDLQYVGVEPKPQDAQAAMENIKSFHNAKIYNQLAYTPTKEQDFDVCISLSVLEHVKQLEKFLVNSVQSVKTGGHIIHRYDLGHALYPASWKEKLNIFLGNNFPKILPEDKFVRYLDQKEVITILENNGAKVKKITYHQMPNHKAFLKYFQTDTDDALKLAKDILEWEFKVSPLILDMNKQQRELLFPAITIWAEKK